MDNNILLDLVQQAASMVNMVSPDDLADAEDLMEIFEQITSQLEDIKEVSGQLQSKATQATSSAAQILKNLPDDDTEEAEDHLKSVSDTIIALQELVDKAASGDFDTDAIDFPDFTSINEAVEVVPQAPAETGTVPEPTEPKAPQAPQVSDVIIPEEDVPLILDFIAESQEHIEAAEAGLLELENAPDDSESINTIFRGFHTIKGMAGFLNLTELGSLAHSSENLLDLARKGQLTLVGPNMDVIFESIDLLKKMATELKDAVEAGAPVPTQQTLPQLIEKLKACSHGEVPVDTSPVEQEKTNTEPTQVAQTETTDSPQPEQSESAITEQPAAKTQQQTTTKQAQPASKMKQKHADEKIKVSTKRLDKLVNMAGELVIAHSMLARQAEMAFGDDDHLLAGKVSHQGKIVRELQELAMLMRMVPIQGVFGKMARLVRDLSRKSGKKINFITSGEDTELDRNVVDLIADPLVHMVRNSMDHGIETDGQREKAGKDLVGNVQLRAFHQSGNIVIELEDDGKGLDREKILNKAIANGVVTAEQELTDQEVYKLIFHAGLSTAEKITEVSGRGVGMDVVKKNIESLRGKVEIDSTPGKGTIFTIRLPLTLAIIDGQVVRVGTETYIIPIVSIERCLRPTSEQMSTVYGRGEIASVHGELLPVVRLYDLFGVKPDTEDPTESSLVVVEEDGKKGAFVVDELLDQQQIVIKSLGQAFDKVKGVSGGAIMGDGKVSLILDIPGLMQVACS